jgi:hypothetical protein
MDSRKNLETTSRSEGTRMHDEQSVTTAVAFVAEEFLYVFPPHAGKVLLDQYSKLPGSRRQAEWLGSVLGWSAEELVVWVEREGDEEDKMVMLDVFLWKQRHGLIDPGLRVDYEFRRWPDGSYLHRYMVANGYEQVLTIPQYRAEPTTYLERINVLLDSFRTTDFTEEDFWELVFRINVLGPKIHTYPRQSEVLAVADYVLAHYDNDARLKDFTNSVCFSHLALLFLDLGLSPQRTWTAYRAALLHSPIHGVTAYPALKAGLGMYGERFREEMKNVEIQGGKSLFYALCDETGLLSV